MKMKNEKGVTLLSLVIAVIVLSIISGISVTTGVGSIRSAKYTELQTELKVMQAKINEIGDIYEEENKTLGTDIGTNEQEILNTTEVEEQLKKKAGNDTTKLEAIKNGFRLCTQDYIKQELGIENVKRDYIVNLSERIVVADKKYSYQDVDYYMLEQMQNSLYNVTYNNQISSTGSFTVTSTKENSQYKITIKVNHEKYVSNWQIKYKLQSESTWHEANDLSFYVTSAGTYQIKVGFGDEVDLGTKTITLN